MQPNRIPPRQQHAHIDDRLSGSAGRDASVSTGASRFLVGHAKTRRGLSRRCPRSCRHAADAIQRVGVSGGWTQSVYRQHRSERGRFQSRERFARRRFAATVRRAPRFAQPVRPVSPRGGHHRGDGFDGPLPRHRPSRDRVRRVLETLAAVFAEGDEVVDEGFILFGNCDVQAAEVVVELFHRPGADDDAR